MSETVDIEDAQARFSQLVDRAANGEEVIIARNGRPVARIVAFRQPSTIRRPGRLRGKIRIGRNFDDPLPDGLFERGEG